MKLKGLQRKKNLPNNIDGRLIVTEERICVPEVRPLCGQQASLVLLGFLLGQDLDRGHMVKRGNI